MCNALEKWDFILSLHVRQITCSLKVTQCLEHFFYPSCIYKNEELLAYATWRILDGKGSLTKIKLRKSENEVEVKNI